MALCVNMLQAQPAWVAAPPQRHAPQGCRGRLHHQVCLALGCLRGCHASCMRRRGPGWSNAPSWALTGQVCGHACDAAGTGYGTGCVHAHLWQCPIGCCRGHPRAAAAAAAAAVQPAACTPCCSTSCRLARARAQGCSTSGAGPLGSRAHRTAGSCRRACSCYCCSGHMAGLGLVAAGRPR